MSGLSQFPHAPGMFLHLPTYKEILAGSRSFCRAGYGRKRVENELFLRFKNHYDFRCKYCNINSPNQNGHVEGKIGYLRRNLFVPGPKMQEIDEYNKELLERCMRLHDRKHHLAKKSIIEIFDRDRQVLLQLPDKDFEVATYLERNS